MILDNFLMFTGKSNGATGGITSTANTDAPTTGTQDASNIIDLAFAFDSSYGQTSPNGRDIGIGDDPMLKILAAVTTTFTGGTSLAIELQGAPDNGSGAPGTFTIMWLGPVVVEANLIPGATLSNVDVPLVIPGQPLPRFLKMTFISVGTHTAGQVEATIAVDRFDQIKGTTGALSGYAAGVVVPN